jgi:hypothetical protein
MMECMGAAASTPAFGGTYSAVTDDKSIRAAIGFALGLMLGALAFQLSGAGHGTYAPMVANVSILAFIPVLGILIAVFGAPLLWSFYFVLIPRIGSQARRLVALSLVTVLHLIPGLWLAFKDPAFARALQSHAGIVLAYGLALIFTILCLALFSSTQRRQPKC